MEDFQKIIAKKILELLNSQQVKVTTDQIVSNIERPKEIKNGDYALPVFFLAKLLKQAPNVIAENIVEQLGADEELLFNLKAVGPYVNFFLNRQQVSEELLEKIQEQGSKFGTNALSNNGVITIDMSSPNIAKPMSVGHLRSTVIGNALANIAQKNGYQPIKINYLGDWGTQFGLMMAAYELWGNKPIEEYSIEELVELYVRINQEAKDNVKLADAGRNWFKRLEDGDEQAKKLWQVIRENSLKEFTDIYTLLDIQFDSYDGESFFNDKMQPIVDQLNNQGLLSVSEGASIVDFEQHGINNLPVALIQRTDGASLYMTRDLAAAVYRKEKYNFDKSLYVVGSEQSEHFTQLKSILKLMQFDWTDDIEHIAFGLITVNGTKMSTRKGNFVQLIDLLNESKKLALNQIEEKNPLLNDKEKIAEEVGYGAVIFHDLMNERTKSIDFDLNEIVRFEGDTGPYIQYSNARIQSILKKFSELNVESKQKSLIVDDETWSIISTLAQFNEIIERSWTQREPSIIAKYILNLARKFNGYYASRKILVDDDQLLSRISLITTVSIVLNEGLRLLGIKAPSEM